ncbi:MAG: trigger factor [Rickettsiaceae bacterium]|nr:trigger factor [Rickettsiaceae bacterium]
MIISELKKDKTEFHVKVIIPFQEISKQIEVELASVAKTAKMDGFRVGKVPLSVLRKKYVPTLRSSIARDKIDAAIKKIVKDNNLNIAFDPAIEDFKNEDNQDLEFVLKFELLPLVTLPDFKKISIEKPVLEVSQKDIDENLDKILRFSKSYDKETKSKAKSGDQVTIDAIGYVDEKAFDGGKLNSHKLVLGSKSFIPGFEDQLIGSKAGDDVSVKVDFPKDYHSKDLAGKPSEFKVKVLAVHHENVPKIDDEFAKKFKCDNVEQLREQIAANIRSNYDESILVLMKMKLFDKLEDLLKFDIPASLLKREKEILKGQTPQLADDAELKNMSDKEKDKYFDELAARRVRIGLMLAEYVKQKDLTITEADVRQAIMEHAKNYPGQEQMVVEFYKKNNNALENLKGPILETKGVKAIFDNEIIIKEKSYTSEKLEKLLENELRD